MSELSPRHRVVRRPSWAALIEGLVVLTFFTAVAVVATWPLARHPLGGFYGFGNDNLGTMWVYGWLHAAYFGPSSTSFSPELQAPFGWQIPEQAARVRTTCWTGRSTRRGAIHRPTSSRGC